MRAEMTARMLVGTGPVKGLVSGLCAVIVTGCGPSVQPSFDSVEPAARNAAIVEAARAGDISTAPQLVRMLSSDDATTRVLAIRTLERMTGETRGFDASASERSRQEAIDRWDAWLLEQRPTTPTGEGGGR